MTKDILPRWLRFIDRHKGVAALIGGFCSVTAGAAWWLAKGGAVAMVTSVTALSQQDVANTLAELPAYHDRVEAGLADLKKAQADTHAAMLQVVDTLETLRRETEQVVEWAPEHSQRLTDAVGGCFAGETCTVYFRGRRTQAGTACELVVSKPRIVLPDGREFPTTLADGYRMTQLGPRFETLAVEFVVPSFIEPGVVGVVVMTIYADCPFAGVGELVERDTFRLLVEIKQR